MNVWYPEAAPDVLDELRKLVPDDVVASNMEPSRAEMLIEGRPSRERLASAPGLRWVVIPFAGVPAATLQVMAEFPNIALHNLHHNAPHTAETAIALLMAAAKRTVQADEALRRNDWGPRYTPEQTMLLNGKKALILGHGEIGKRIGEVLRALEMDVSTIRRNPRESGEFGPADLMGLLGETNVLVVAAPLTPETTGMIGSAQLKAMPPGGILVNIAGGPIVDEEAMFLALQSGHLHSAGIDVWYQYPKEEEFCPPSRFPFHDLENVVMSPHRGGMAAGTEQLRQRDLARLVRAAAEGSPVPNQIDLSKGY